MRRWRAVVPVFAAVFGISMLGTAKQAAADPYQIAVLQGLDKVTARVSTLYAPVGQSIKFGNLEIIARYCDKRPPTEPPESAAFLDIWENHPGEPSVSVFRGWMFASSPAVSALEHPVYDIWVLDCKNPDDVNGQGAATDGATTGDKPADNGSTEGGDEPPDGVTNEDVD